MTIRTTEDFAAWAADHLDGLTYVGPDPHYGIGLETLVPRLRIACADHPPAVDLLRDGGMEVWTPTAAATADDGSEAPTTEEVAAEHAKSLDGSRNAAALLESGAVASFLERRSAPKILVFKSSHAIEVRCRERGWHLLAGPARTARRWENKVAFRALASGLGLRQPPGRIVAAEDLHYATLAEDLGPRLVLQSAHGYAGNRTAFVDSPEALREARHVLRGRRIRAASMMGGVPWTLNACVLDRGIAVGAPFRQITGLPELTGYALGSCGQDWTWQVDDPGPFVDVARTVGEALRGEGYRGVIGLDFIAGDDGIPYVIEVNPRLVASVAAYTQLESAAGRLPMLARHVLAHVAPELDGAPMDLHMGPVIGSQLVFHHVRGSEASTPALATGGWKIEPPMGRSSSTDRSPSPPRCVTETVRLDELPPHLDLVLAPEPNRTIRPGDAWLRVQRHRRAIDHDGTLLPEVAAWVRWLQEQPIDVSSKPRS